MSVKAWNADGRILGDSPFDGAGYSRVTRDRKKSPGLPPQQLTQITKSLIIKNGSTPSQPHDATWWNWGRVRPRFW